MPPSYAVDIAAWGLVYSHVLDAYFGPFQANICGRWLLCEIIRLFSSTHGAGTGLSVEFFDGYTLEAIL
jgi:hypothetical protein